MQGTVSQGALKMLARSGSALPARPKGDVGRRRRQQPRRGGETWAGGGGTAAGLAQAGCTLLQHNRGKGGGNCISSLIFG